MILKLKDGDVKIELFPDVAPNHVKRIKKLADSGKYDGVVFHRVIDGFMAQTGDVLGADAGVRRSTQLHEAVAAAAPPGWRVRRHRCR